MKQLLAVLVVLIFTLPVQSQSFVIHKGKPITNVCYEVNVLSMELYGLEQGATKMPAAQRTARIAELKEDLRVLQPLAIKQQAAQLGQFSGSTVSGGLVDAVEANTMNKLLNPPRPTGSHKVSTGSLLPSRPMVIDFHSTTTLSGTQLTIYPRW